jgi:hypothetical protein
MPSRYTAPVLERAFAINAPPARIWDALTGDLAAGDDARYHVERAVTPRELVLSVELQGGVRAQLTYTLIPRPDHTEVVATIAPQGLRYAVARLLTLGRVDTNYQLLLTQGLANLKQAVEGDEGRTDANEGEANEGK